MEDGRPELAERVDSELVQRLRTRQAAEHGEHGPIRRQPEQRSPVRLLGAEVRRRDRTADDPVLRAVAALDGVREEHAPGQRRGEPVREPEVRIGLGEHGRNASQPRCEHHRPCDVAPAAEDDIGTTARQDPAADERRTHRLTDGAEEPEADASREAGDREGVELEAGLRNELRLDAVWRPGERHRHSAFPKHLCDCERGPDVSCRPSRRDHAPKPWRPVHSRRC